MNDRNHKAFTNVRFWLNLTLWNWPEYNSNHDLWSTTTFPMILEEESIAQPKLGLAKQASLHPLAVDYLLSSKQSTSWTSPLLLLISLFIVDVIFGLSFEYPQLKCSVNALAQAWGWVWRWSVRYWHFSYQRLLLLLSGHAILEVRRRPSQYLKPS